MKQFDFAKQKEADWVLFERVLEDKELARQHDLPKMLRQLSHDLAIAKSRHYSPAVISHLNELLLRGQQQLYKPTNRVVSPFLHFIKDVFPRHLTEMRIAIIWAHALFYGVGLIAFVLTIYEPDFIRHVIPNSQVVGIEEMYDPSSERFKEERASDSDFLMFGHYILNNISIAFRSFVGGLLLGFGALYILFFNAMYIGTISGHIVNVGYGSTFFSFVVTHGSFELTAIVLSAAAGFVMGYRLMAPGELTRADALKQTGKRVVPVVFGAFLLLVIAAFVEAFWSSSQTIPNAVKYTVGAICWLCVLVYTFKRAKNAH
ncbi:stage II sporulation protein M [Alteromonadaceae bacterium M269]|nr:stage II sporulation protein M [Alteromonadaceae bacterium M269]